MDQLQFATGQGRCRVSLRIDRLGSDLVAFIYNKGAHLGAVAVAEWDGEHNRVSVSVHTRLGHKDDAVAQRAAYAIAKSTRATVCVVAGIHLDDIRRTEIERILVNTDLAVDKFLARIPHSPTSPFTPGNQK
ncbi:MAG: hypothetical protein A2147_09550 [Chloroflexi bacterium RBG_16_57_8]|nr:MAG: hypothetical protein A2147_09550 [Chloroflexi bacterium RBG_16_57_8]